MRGSGGIPELGPGVVGEVAEIEGRDRDEVVGQGSGRGGGEQLDQLQEIVHVRKEEKELWRGRGAHLDGDEVVVCPFEKGRQLGIEHLREANLKLGVDTVCPPGT